MHPKQRGVTLIELMVVVVVIAILSSIAIPSYRNYVMRSNRTEATTALLRVQAAQEKAFLQNNAYATQITGAAPAGLNMSAATERNKYALDIQPGAVVGGYIARAQPVAGEGQDDDSKCQVFTIDQSGVRGAQDGGGTDQREECWR